MLSEKVVRLGPTVGIDCHKMKEITSENQKLRICRESDDDSFKKVRLERIRIGGDI